jgi:prepilin peptidase CpaA
MTGMTAMRVGLVHGGVADAVFAALLVTACAMDLRARRIPNGLVGCIAILGVVYSILTMPGLAGGVHAVGGLGVGLAIWLPFYALGSIGAGDVKFFAAAATWLGAVATMHAALAAAVAGALLAVGWMVAACGWRSTLARIAGVLARPWMAIAPAPAPASPAHQLPYGLAMATGLAVAAWLPSW